MNFKSNHDITLPDDILRIIFQTCLLQDIKNVRSFSLVCKKWNRIASDSALWKEYVLTKWPVLATSKRIKNWKFVAKRRFTHNTSLSEDGIIENCEETDFHSPLNGHWKFKCPLSWNNLEKTKNSLQRFCNTCKKTVYYCNSVEDLTQNASLGRCVAFNPSRIQKSFRTKCRVIISGPPNGGKSTFLKHIQRSKEAEDSIYLKENVFDPHAVAVVLSTETPEDYSLYFHEQHEKLVFAESIEREVYVVIYKEGDAASWQAAQKIQHEKSPLLLFGNKPGQPGVTTISYSHLVGDCSNARVVKGLVDLIIQKVFAQYDEVTDEEMGSYSTVSSEIEAETESSEDCMSEDSE